MSRRYLLYGPAGTWKSSFPLVDATPEHPISYHELELGGFERAAKRLKLSEGAVLLHTHRQPFNNLTQIGQVVKTGAGNAMPQLKYELDGWVDMFSGFANSYMDDIKVGMIPVVDTATRTWLVLRNFYAELCQKAGADIEKLSQLKYTEPKSIHLSLLEFPKAYNVDSVWIAHEEKVFNSDPPIYQADCMAEVPNNIDISLRFRLVNNEGVATVMKGGEAGALVGLEIPHPTLRKVNAIVDVVALLESEGETYEKDAEQLLNMAQLRGVY